VIQALVLTRINFHLIESLRWCASGGFHLRV